MKIAYVCTEKLPAPAVRGGAIQMMIDGIAPLIARRHELTIFSIADPLLPPEETDGDIRYIRFPKATYETDVARALAAHKFDVVHVFNRPVPLIDYQAAAPQSAFVLSLHNDMFSPLKMTANQAKRALDACTLLTAVSEYIKQTVTDRYLVDPKKIKVIYSGVNLAQYIPVWTEEGRRIRQSERKAYGLTDKKVVLFLGRLSKTKGPHLLIQCLPSLLTRHPETALVIAGGKWFNDNSRSEYIDWLYELASPMADRIIFTNYVPHNHIPKLLLIADVFVCSSQWHEPLARVHYEAMAAGIPVVTTNRGGNAEIVRHGETGFVIDDYQNPHAFFEAIDYMLVNKHEAETMAKNARMLVEQQFQFHHVAKRFETVYIEAYSSLSPNQ
ncbi:glycosyl transferase [Geobacillus thermocatenulatus]|uniref:Glycosyl transferase n=1 Tax=Geobacillus thermocatenulatus TaxID=33938 RepID=A0A226Q4M7_9BACL|nr:MULTISPECIES: glycosyltransferase family 4 protein [Geobacillus]AST00256.1 glycosyl transferase [Geobacillus thermocatenulatus]KLR72212.1 glycosyl transferase [Geobacillus sp. T6]OXB86610.1 glycosyl transferase [Geobacillus thermocatenulatus]RAN30029.1 glycosyl transferase [Geobacillus sp. A8]